MNNQRLNIIVGNRGERLPRLMKEIETQGITNYELWEGIYLPSIVQSINTAHRQIVEYARLAEFGEVVIAEDDIKFSSPGAWQYFLSQKPKEYDIFLGGIFLGDPDENNIVKDFTGMTLYSVHSRFYDRFLSIEPSEHIDRALGGLGRYVVCNPMVCTQFDGISGNTGKFENYGEMQSNRVFW